jgi:flavin-binding protein dodecin
VSPDHASDEPPLRGGTESVDLVTGHRVAEVIEMDVPIEDGDIIAFRTTLRLGSTSHQDD